jgi:hypothetical protein
VHTGVKSAGWENRIPHFSPRKLWKSMSPCVVFALKFGALEISASILLLRWPGKLTSRSKTQSRLLCWCSNIRKETSEEGGSRHLGRL